VNTLDPEFPQRRVLVIAYYFPPMGLSGVQRTLKFVKYLPMYGWKPTVLTAEPRGYAAMDESLLEDLAGRDVRIVRTPAAGPGRFLANKEVVSLPPEWSRKLLSRISDSLFIPDNKVGWKKRAVKKALELHAETPFDLIFSTAPPFTDFLVGAEVKKAINKPLVFDYRDPWLDYPFKFYLTPAHFWRTLMLERRALRASSHVVTTNRTVKEIILKRYKFLTYHDVDIITQGFDPDDFPTPAEMEELIKGKTRRRQLRITYAGVFWEDRVPDHFLQALHDLFEEKPRLRGRIEAVFIGTFREENKKLVARLRLHDTVTIHEYLPHKDCVRILCDSDVLWMIVGEGVSSPGKVYEYIGARKPILGCAPDGFIKSTILEAGGTVVGPADVPAIKAALEDYIGKFERHEFSGPREDVVEKYNRVTLTRSLVKIFESLLAV
jgi:glycosyltransferase involved in cell wall biosynthesis